MSPGLMKWCVFVAAFAIPVGAVAADLAVQPAPASSGWIVTVGAEGRIQPKFVGSDDFAFYPYPLFSVRRAGTPPEFRSPRDGFGFALFDNGTLSAGPVAQIVWRRKESDSSALFGLGNVDTAVELGAFINYWPTRFIRAHVELRNGIGGHHGFVTDLALDGVFPVTAQWTLSGGPRMRIATSAALDPYFSVTPLQSLTSGLPVFNAGGGVQSVGAGVQARYEWNAQWATHAFVEYDRLLGDTANSPLVSLRGSADQWTFGTGVTYSFAFSGF